MDQDANVYSGIYQGNSFPTVAPATAPMLMQTPADYVPYEKVISVSFLKSKMDEFINNRNGLPGQSLLV